MTIDQSRQRSPAKAGYARNLFEPRLHKAAAA